MANTTPTQNERKLEGLYEELEHVDSLLDADKQKQDREFSAFQDDSSLPIPGESRSGRLHEQRWQILDAIDLYEEVSQSISSRTKDADQN